MDSSTIASKKSHGEMLTKTIIGDSTVDMVRDDPRWGTTMVEHLMNHGLLLTNSSQLEELSRRLPMRVWKTLENEILKCRVAKALLVDGLASSVPEVVLSETGHEAHSAAQTVPLHEYPSVPAVERRRQLRDGTSHVSNRNELWKWCIEPVVASMPISRRKVFITDPYLFADLHRESNRKANRTLPDHNFGLPWLLQKLRDSVDSRCSWNVEIVTLEKRDNDVDLACIQSLSERFIKPVVTSTFKVTLHVLSDRVRHPDDLREATHKRYTYFDERRRFEFDFGLSDLDVRTRGDQIRDRSEVVSYSHSAASDFSLRRAVIFEQYKALLWRDRPGNILTF